MFELLKQALLSILREGFIFQIFNSQAVVVTDCTVALTLLQSTSCQPSLGQSALTLCSLNPLQSTSSPPWSHRHLIWSSIPQNPPPIYTPGGSYPKSYHHWESILSWWVLRYLNKSCSNSSKWSFVNKLWKSISPLLGFLVFMYFSHLNYLHHQTNLI